MPHHLLRVIRRSVEGLRKRTVRVMGIVRVVGIVGTGVLLHGHPGHPARVAIGAGHRRWQHCVVGGHHGHLHVARHALS